MKSEKDIQKSHLLLAVAMLGVFAVLLVLNIWTPMVADDYLYANSTPHSFLAILQVTANDYMVWNGRWLAIFFMHAFSIAPLALFDGLNAAVFTAMTFFLYKFVQLCKGKEAKEESPLLYLVLCCCVWLLAPAFGETILWCTGAVVYLWGVTALLAWLYPLCKLYILDYTQEKSPAEKGVLKALGMALLGFVAGSFSENTVPACIGVALCLLWHRKVKQKRKLPAWSVSAVVGATLGWLALVLAPGVRVRAATGADTGYSPLMKLVFRAIMSTHYMMHYAVLAVVFVAAFVFLFAAGKRQSLVLPTVLFVWSIAAGYAMMLSPLVISRTFFGSFIMMLAACGCLLVQCKLPEALQKRGVLCLASIGLFLMTFVSVGFAGADILATYRVDAMRVEALQSAAPGATVTLPLIHPLTEYNAMCVGDIFTNGSGEGCDESLAAVTGFDGTLINGGDAYVDWGTMTEVLLS